MERLFVENCMAEVRLSFRGCVTKREEPINGEYGDCNLVFTTTMGIVLGFVNMAIVYKYIY